MSRLLENKLKKVLMINRLVTQLLFEENPSGNITIPGWFAELKLLNSENRCALVRMTFVAKWFFFPLFFYFFSSRLCSISKMAHVHPSCFQPLANLNQLPDQKYLRGITLQHSHLVASPLWSLRASPTPLLCHRCGTKWKLSRLKSDFFHDDKWGKKKNQKKPDLGYEIKRQCVSLCVFMSYLMTGNVIMNGSGQMWLAAVVMWRFDFQTALAGNVNPDVLIHKPTAREINAGFFSWGCDWKSI